MPRRQLTFGLAVGLSFVLVALAFSFSVPYVALTPGPAFDTLAGKGKEQVLTIAGARTYPTVGTLRLTTVNVRDEISLAEALKGWFSGREAIVPREFLYPPDQSSEQVDKQNVADMKASQSDATMAALSELGLATIAVGEVTKGGGSEGKLRPGDVIVAVDGTPVHGASSLRGLVRKHAVGEVAEVRYSRAGVLGTARITTGPSADKPPKAALGIITKLASPVKVTIRLQDVGGPSAGLMFALGIIEKLGPESLTGGKDIAGTGTISADGSVGAIGGIAEKMVGAQDEGATVFLSPGDNCAEAKQTKPDGLTLIRADTLHEAVVALESLRDGRTPASC